MSKNTANFGEKLRLLRKNLGKSQAEVAQEIGEQFPEEIRISQKTLSALEQRDSAPREETLEIIAAYYKVPVTYFFEAESDREGTARAKAYLEKLKSLDTRNLVENNFAQSSEFRRQNDELSQQLKNLKYSEEDEYLDT